MIHRLIRRLGGGSEKSKAGIYEAWLVLLPLDLRETPALGISVTRGSGTEPSELLED
jgi:hypothetical protein